MTALVVSDNTALASVPATAPVVAKLDSLRGLIKAYDKAVDEYNRLGGEIEAARREIERQMGDATVGTVNNVEEFTYNMKQSWRTTDLKRDHGHLAAAYMREETKLVFDMAKFAADHPAVARQYQSREFRRVSGKNRKYHG